MAVNVNGMVGHREIADPDAHAITQSHGIESMPGNTRLLNVHKLKSSIVMMRGVALPGIDVVCREQEHEVAVHGANLRSLGCVTQKPIIPIAICTISSA
jgi:hypothetical protein